MEFLERADDIGYVLNHVNRPHLAKGTVAKRIGEVIQVGDDIRAGIGIPINTDGARIFVDPAADIQNRQLVHRARRRDRRLDNPR